MTERIVAGGFVCKFERSLDLRLVKSPFLSVVRLSADLPSLISAHFFDTHWHNKINDNLQSTLQALYGYWFMQFDYPDANGRPYKSSGGRMSYNEKLGCSIPEGWHVASIVNNPLTDVITPGVDLFKTKTYYATADVNGMDIGTGSPVNYETRESRANMQPRLHTVWFAKMKNSVKHLFLGHSMKQVIEESILSTGFMGLQCKEAAFEYISAFIDGPYFERAKDQYANGATQQAVGNAELESVYLVVPDDETLARFHELTRGLVESIGKTIIENKKLVELRDWLLPMLMNGQATVEATQPNYRLRGLSVIITRTIKCCCEAT